MADVYNTVTDTTSHETTDMDDARTSRILEWVGVVALLAAIIGGGAYFRFVGLDWGETFHLHPDERFMIDVTSLIAIPDSLDAYFDTENSPLNPYNVGKTFYVYGNFPLTVVRYLAEQAGTTGYFDGVHMVGRRVSAVADLFTIAIVFLIGQSLFDRRVGLLGALFYACAALPIQLAHFWTVDGFTTTLTMAAFLIAVWLFKRHNWLLYPLFGLFLGLAMASKVSAFPMALILMLALALRVGVREHDIPFPKAATRAFIGLSIAGLVTILVFRVAMPYAFLPADHTMELTELEGAMGAVIRTLEPTGMAPNPLWIDQLESASVQASRVADAPPNHQWRNRTPILWPLGNIIYPGLGWPLGLFAVASMLWAGWEIARGHKNAIMLALPLAWTVLILGYEGTGWVKVMRYFHHIYPTLVLLAAWGIFTLWDRILALLASRRVRGWHWAHSLPGVVSVIVVVGAIGWGFAVSNIYTRPLTRLEASRWIVENVPADFTILATTAEGEAAPIQIGLPNNGPPITDDTSTTPAYNPSQIPADSTRTIPFEVEQTLTVSGIRINDVNRFTGDEPVGQLTFAIAGQGVNAQAQTEPAFAGGGATLRFAEPITLEAGEAYTLDLQNPHPYDLLFTGSVIAVEGAWDDPVPQTVDGARVRTELFHELRFDMAAEDTEEKRARMLHILNETDYITISSNRFYDSLSRNPRRWPVTIRYYQALFSGELGFRLVGDFTSRPNIGPIEFYDDEADEAWTVYDHPRVFVFEKTAAYSSEQATAILNSVDLTTVVRENAADATGQPVRIQRPDEYPQPFILETTAQTGDALPGAFAQLGTVIVWWAAVTLIGLVTVPLLYSIFPGIAGRGWGLARMAGLLLVGWLAWLLSSLRLIVWGRLPLLIALVVVALVSLLLIRKQWPAFRIWLKANRRHIIITETLFAALFLGFVLVRLANPDLWHPFFGGEKPMDLAYFNAVLNTRYFPPYDPWFAGGTINYYYFGFVLAAVPTKLLGVSSSVAYNLLIPTFFALTGLGLFSMGHALVGDETQAPAPLTGGDLIDKLATLGQNAGLVAGLLALLFGLLLGNLDQIRRPLWGLAELGAGESLWAFSPMPPADDVVAGLDMHLTEGHTIPIPIGDWYWNATRLIPVPLENDRPTEIQPITEFPMFTFIYADLHAHMIAFPVTLFILAWGVGLVRAHDDLKPGLNAPWIAALVVGAVAAGSLIGINTWDVPTYLALGAGFIILRFIMRTPDDAAPVGLLLGGVLGVFAAFGVYYAVISSGSPNPEGPPFELIFAAAAGGIMLLVGYTLGISKQGLERWVPLLKGVLWAVPWAGVAVATFLPYILNFRSEYSGFIPWSGSHTPVWAYVIMFGLPLFVIITWLLLETLAMLRGVAVKLHRGILVPLIAAVIVAVVGLIWLGGQVPMAWLAMPVLIWAGVVYARPAQTVPKRLTLLLIITAMAITMLVEIVVLQGDVGRMNTVFKFYLQVWFMLSISAAVSLPWVWVALDDARLLPAFAWRAALTVLIALAALYPLTASQAKMTDRWAQDAPINLDGMVYMPHVQRFEDGTTFPLDADFHALRWLRDNVEGTPTILEAHTTEYRWGSRVTVYTGYPAVIGWNWHQRQQRPWQSMEVFRRVESVNRAYGSEFMGDALIVLDEYDVDMVIVGELERAIYPEAGLAKFEEMAALGYLTPVFEYGQTVIYLVEKGTP